MNAERLYVHIQSTTAKLDRLSQTKGDVQKKAVGNLKNMRIWAQRAMMMLYVNEISTKQNEDTQPGRVERTRKNLTNLGEMFTRGLLVTGKMVCKRRVFNLVLNNGKESSLKGSVFVPALSVPLSYLWSVDDSTACRLSILEMQVFMVHFFCTHSHPELPWWNDFMEELAARLANTLATAWSYRLQRKAAAGLAIFASSKASALLLLSVGAHKIIIDKVFQGLYGREPSNQRAIVDALRHQGVDFKEGGRVDTRVDGATEDVDPGLVSSAGNGSWLEAGGSEEKKGDVEQWVETAPGGHLSVYYSALRVLVLLCAQTVKGDTEVERAITSYIKTWVNFPLAESCKAGWRMGPANLAAALFLWISNDVSHLEARKMAQRHNNVSLPINIV